MKLNERLQVRPFLSKHSSTAWIHFRVAHETTTRVIQNLMPLIVNPKGRMRSVIDSENCVSRNYHLEIARTFFSDTWRYIERGGIYCLRTFARRANLPRRYR